MTILIPAYEPDKRLLDFICNIRKLCNFNIVIVDDGSGDIYNEIFKSAEAQGCTILRHKTNKGKGRALKTGFSYIKSTEEKEGVVCADSDGQHLPADTVKIAKNILEHRSHIILGSRRFTGKVPIRSRFGNTVTRLVYSFSTGSRIYDTQTGLRGYSVDMLDWLCRIPGERFEYEMNVLLEADKDGYPFYEVDIDTVYHSNNKSSHFRTIADSARVYFPILKFCASSLLSGLLDFALVMFINYITSNLLFAVLGARMCSSAFNYILNKFFVFSRGKHYKAQKAQKSLPKYYILVAVILMLNYGFIFVFNKIIHIPLFFAKLLTETILFLFSYWSQRKFVFKIKTDKNSGILTTLN